MTSQFKPASSVDSAFLLHLGLGRLSTFYPAMKHLSIKDALLPQPASFYKKKHYEVHDVLGNGTFGKVVVRTLLRDPLCAPSHS